MRRLFASTVAACAVLLLVAACSSDDDSSAPFASATTSAPNPADPSATVASTTPVSLVIDAPEISGDNPPRPDELDLPTMPTVCVLLSTDEVAGAIGEDIALSEEGGTVRDQIPCQFSSASGDPLFRLTATGPDHSPPPAEMLDELLAEPGAVDHPDVGDGAVVTADGVSVLVGDQLYTLRVIGEGLDVDSAEILELAGVVASRA